MTHARIRTLASRRQSLVAGVALVAVSTALAGCGGGNSGNSTTASGSTPGVDTATKTITLGGWQTASGPTAVYKAVHDGAEAYFDSVNASGGVNGWKIKYDVPDDGGDPARALQAVRDQITSKKVFAIVCGAGSPENAQVTPFIDQSQFLYVSPNDNGDSYLGKGYKTIFPVVPPYTSLVAMDAKYAIDSLGAKSIALLYENDAVGQPVEAKFNDIVASAGGTVATTVPFDASDVDFTAVGHKLATAKPDVVIQVGSPTALVKGKKAASDAGLDAKWFGPFYAADPSVTALDPTTMNGVYFDSFLDGFFQDTPAISDYKAALAKYEPSDKPGGLSLLGWAGASTFIAGLQAATADGSAPTEAKMISALETFNAKQITVAPAVTYSSGNHEGISSGYVMQYEDGDFSRAGGPFPFDYFKD